MGNKVSAEFTISSGAPPPQPQTLCLYAMLTVSRQDNNIIIKSADVIKDGDESSYRELVNNIIVYGEDSDLSLDIETTGGEFLGLSWATHTVATVKKLHQVAEEGWTQTQVSASPAPQEKSTEHPQ